MFKIVILGVAAGGDSENEDDQEAVDMEAFIESGMLDSATVDVEKKSKNVSNKKSESGGGGEIENVRTYDLNITYDKFYQTPRLWLFGYDESRKALSVDEMYEDFSAGQFINLNKYSLLFSIIYLNGNLFS